MGSLRDQATSDWERFSSDPDGFGTTISFEAPSAETADIVGLASKHHINIDSEGNPVSTKNAHCSASEKLLVDAGYPVRLSDEVAMIGHKVSWVDSTGASKDYAIEQHFPDETVGMITFILGDRE